MKKPALIIIFLIGLVMVLSVVKAVVQNKLSTSGVFLAEVEQQISFYKTQNAVLFEELLASSSITNIVAKAEKLGFTNKNSSPLVIETSRPFAVRP